MWANRMQWTVPLVHVRICAWLQDFGELGLLMCHRGIGKSTLLAVYNAWRFYLDPRYRILHQSESDPTARKTSRDTQNVLRRHPLTKHLLADNNVSAESWWVTGSDDPRNSSMHAKGIMSNVTSARADECQNDDVEVPKNIQKPEAREKLRYRLGEQNFILVPGGRQLYVGTPHTHDSLYDDIRALGASVLEIRMFEQEHRIEAATEPRHVLPFLPEVVFIGIGKTARLLKEGVDYRLEGTVLILAKPTGALVDCYAGIAWPERFTPTDLLKRRRKTRTLNEWDSQYQLHSKPVGTVRIDPAKITPYDVEPVLRTANGGTVMSLGAVQIVGAAARWDPSSGKLNSDSSAFAVTLQDGIGRRYLQAVVELEGDVATFSPDGKKIIGGQVWQICDEVEKYSLSRVSVETNGIGGFAPAVLKACLKQRRLPCGVSEVISTTKKAQRILETFEPLLLTPGQLWAHVDVLNGPFWDQAKDWNPMMTNAADDLLDASAGALTETPERVGKIVGNTTPRDRDDWRPEAGTFEVTLET